MTNSPHAGGPAGDPQEELREQVKRTREQLGETVEALAAKADVKARAQEKAAHAKDQVRHSTARALHLVHGEGPRAKARAQEKAAHAAHVVQDQAPQQVRTAATRVARTSRGNRGPLLVAAGVVALLAVMVVRRRHTGRWC